MPTISTLHASHEVPQGKLTSLGLYVTAQEAYEMWKAGPERVKILDVRMVEEYVFLGHAAAAVNIPLALPYWVLVAAEPVTDVDTTAAEMLVDLDVELNASDIHLAFAELKEPVKESIIRYGLLETIDYRHFYPTLETAVAAFHEERQSSKETSTSVSE